LGLNPDSDFAWREAPKVKAWEQSLRESGCSLDSLTPLNLLNKRDGELLFALVEARGRDAENRLLLPYALLRGPACVVIPVCRNRQNGESRFLMVRQRRIGHGGLSLEFPAGMLDGDLHDPAGTAVRELEEETGLHVDRSALTPLWGKPLYSSPGLSDESIYFFTVEIEMDNEAWRRLEGGKGGHAHEGEYITTTLKTFAEAAAELTSIQPLMAFLLYQRRSAGLK
jgi:8-oxo-dGTP pyrophosphatase MutT (NUDIX family)